MAKKRSPTETETLTAAQRSCRAGDLAGLLAWAADLESANEADAAAVIRAVPEFAEYALPPLTQWRTKHGRGSITLVHLEGAASWWCEEQQIDDSQNGGPNRWTDLVVRLLEGWNRYRFAVEWLARRLELPRVQLDPSPNEKDVNLHESEHLPPLPADQEMTMVTLGPSVPASHLCPVCLGQSVYWGDTRTCKECDNLSFPNRGKPKRRRRKPGK